VAQGVTEGVTREVGSMKLILKQDVDDVGLEGDLVNVAKGFGRNFLIPRGLAALATPQNMKAFEQQRKKIEVRRLKAKDEALKLKERVSQLVLTFTEKAGEEGKLFGSVTSMHIAEAMEKQGVVIDRRKILLDKPIKALGEFAVPVKIYPTVTGNVKVVVAPQEGQ
jgi:large subunit ribosomal protein L9